MATIHKLFKDNQAVEPGTNPSSNPAEQQEQAALLALSTNANLLEIVQLAAPRGSRVVKVGTLDTMLNVSRSLRPAILFIDTDSCADIPGTVIQLWQELPELVVVAAGSSEESSKLMKLTAAGHLYRFLLKPLAHNQTKLTLEAALNQHADLLASADRRSNATVSAQPETVRKNYLPAYMGLGFALIAVAGLAFYSLSRMGSDDQENATRIATVPVSSTTSTELDLADAALAAGKLLEPPGESALDLYRSALAIDTTNQRAQAGIEAVASKLLEQAEAALTAEQLEAAVVALEQARDVSPDNTRLKFLDGQLARERERLKLTQGQDLSKKVRTLLADAQEAMDAGRLIAPAGNNARASILEARRIDATDPGVAQAQRALSTLLIEAARRAAEQNQNEPAQNYLSAARQLGSAGAELSAAERAINSSSSRSSAAAEAQLNAAREAAAQAQRDAALAAAAQSAAEATTRVADEAAQTKAQTPVPLKRIKTVAPAYPASANSRGLSGWADVAFTVDESGNVTNARIANAEPKNIFDAAALAAVEQWRFEPPMRDGKAVSQATRVKLRFDNPR